ncbi:hypothetical protein [Burkholderia cepacia]|uniref:hypothetical protein n=1 Tax=Burkholderia cepacia TaxID=292 RepID=UPI0012D368D7|nr:hypothetical protein [Burkholderia cepacia]
MRYRFARLSRIRHHASVNALPAAATSPASRDNDFMERNRSRIARRDAGFAH